jgi:hypothetical protein
MGNLIFLKRSFEWFDHGVNRNEYIKQLNAAINLAREYGDNIFRTHDLFEINLPWGNLFEVLYQYNYDEEIKTTIFPWMSEIDYNTLTNLIRLIGNPTPNKAIDLHSLRNEYPQTNCGNVGFFYTPKPHKYVFDEESWNKFHEDFVSTFSYAQRCEFYDYFSKFFQPYLRIELNQINILIQRNQTPSIIKRIDLPKIVGEKIHIHLEENSNCALNIDGTWKHAPRNQFNISMEARVLLSQWGFKLPEEYYR